jgi:hypothetical protein
VYLSILSISTGEPFRSKRSTAAICLLSYLLQDSQTGDLSAMNAGKWATAEVMKHDVLVIAIDNSGKVVCRPSVGISLERRVDAVVY